MMIHSQFLRIYQRMLEYIRQGWNWYPNLIHVVERMWRLPPIVPKTYHNHRIGSVPFESQSVLIHGHVLEQNPDVLTHT